MMKDSVYMQRCIDLARLGQETAAPNPLVGSVIVHKDRIIGEGWHYKTGLPHAEVNAINSVRDKSLLKESTLYVNLEPCAHHGRTPPCSLLIVKHQLKRVVIGCKDPFAKVNGAGIAILKEAGIAVEVGVLEQASKDLNKSFFTYHQKKRPLIMLKWAQTQDGFFDKSRESGNKGSNWISNEQAKLEVHKLRAKSGAILVGAKTLVNDNPKLNTRLVSGASPLRLVLDRNGITPDDAQLFQDDKSTVLFTSKKRDLRPSVEQVILGTQDDPIEAILGYCYAHQLQLLLVEGGATLLNVFLDVNLWDEAIVYTGSKTFESGLEAPKVEHIKPITSMVGNNLKSHYYNL